MTCSTSSSSGDLELSSIPGLRLSAPPKPNCENGKEVSEEDPAAVQSALKALQDSSDASVLKNKEIQEVELKKKELSNNVRRSGPRY